MLPHVRQRRHAVRADHPQRPVGRHQDAAGQAGRDAVIERQYARAEIRSLSAHGLLAPAATECALYRLRATYPAARALSVLGWEPLVSLDAGMAGRMGRS